MNTSFTNHVTAMMIAGLMTVVTSGSTILSFDAFAQTETQNYNAPVPAVIQLDTVTITAKGVREARSA